MHNINFSWSRRSTALCHANRNTLTISIFFFRVRMKWHLRYWKKELGKRLKRRNSSVRSVGKLGRKCVKKGGTLEVRIGDRKRRRIKDRKDGGEEIARNGVGVATRCCLWKKNREVARAKDRHDVAHGNSQGRSISPPNRISLLTTAHTVSLRPCDIADLPFQHASFFLKPFLRSHPP